MEIPSSRLSPDVLRVLAEEFVAREGTDYGATEVSLDVKVAQVLDQIRQGLVVIRFDPKIQSCGLFPKD